MTDFAEIKRQAEETLTKAIEYESTGHLDIASQSYVKYANLLVELGELNEAMSYLEVADALNPIPLDARVRLADLYFDTEDIENAINEYSNILNLYMEQGLVSSAISLCIDYIEKIPSSTRLRYDLANLYMKSDRTHKAVNIYKEIIERNENVGPALENLADIYIRRNAIKDAVYTLIQASECYTEIKNWSSVVKQYRKILRLRPDLLNVRRDLIKVLYKLNEKDELVNELLILANDLKNKGDEEMASNLFSKVLQIDPSNEIALRHLGATISIKGRDIGIKKISKDKMSDEVSESLRSILDELSERDEDEAKYIDARTRYDIGIAYLEMDLYKEATEQLQLASKDPNYRLRACNLLGMVFIELGELDLAIKAFHRGLKMPVSEEEQLGIRYNLAMTYKKTRAIEKALEQLEEIYIVDVAYLDVKEQIIELKTQIKDIKVKGYEKD